MDPANRNEIMFTQIVLMFHTAAMQQMGKIKNPLTDTVERDLAAAKNSIDILEMLREKTRGNLSQDEGRLLTQVLQELRLNYVDEANKPAPPAGAEGKSDSAS